MSLIEHLEKLRHFQKLANYRSITKCAVSIGMSQAGLSKSISSLEKILEVQLFTRSHDGLTLTKEGQLVFDASKRIFSESTILEQQLRSMKISKLPIKFTIGMYDSIAIYFFSELSNYLQRIYPEIELQLIVDTSDQLHLRIEEGLVDLAIGVNLDRCIGKHTKFITFFTDHYSFFVTRNNIEHIEKLPIMYHPNAVDACGKKIEQYLYRISKNRRVYKIHNFETLKTMTLQGEGVGVLPCQVAKTFVLDKQLIQANIIGIKQLFGEHKIGFLVSIKFLKEHQEFANDILRLSEHWAKI